MKKIAIISLAVFIVVIIGYVSYNISYSVYHTMEYKPQNQEEVVVLSNNWGINNLEGVTIDALLYNSSHSDETRFTLRVIGVSDPYSFLINNIDCCDVVMSSDTGFKIGDIDLNLTGYVYDYYGNRHQGGYASVFVNVNEGDKTSKELVVLTVIRENNDEYVIECGKRHLEPISLKGTDITAVDIYKDHYWDSFIFSFLK